MAGPKTTWEELSRLGWPINDVFNVANAWRNGTMSTTDDLALNGGFAERWQWWSYNTTLGDPAKLSSVPDSIKNEETAWEYTNSSDKPFKDSWSETWTNVESADLRIQTSASIHLSSSISIFNIGSTGIDLTVSTESSEGKHAERTHELSHQWDLEVGPHEKLSLIRSIQTVTTEERYSLPYGLTDGSLVGTHGRIFNEHYYWGLGLNWLLSSRPPRGTMYLSAVGKRVSYVFHLQRENAKGTFIEALPHPIESGPVHGPIPYGLVATHADDESTEEEGSV